jgi:hypothetical protein
VLFYGDHVDRAEPAALLELLRGRVRDLGCDRWSLIEAGRLVQGLLDAEMLREGGDDCTPLADWSARLMLSLAAGDRGRALEELEQLGRVAPLDEVLLRVPEGFAFYAIYPELYGRAAGELAAPVQAIGIRSIGTSLGATVAAMAGGRPALSLRPTGHPFRRELRIGPRLAARLSGADEYAIVDDGPGLSGSSFLSVARELMARGVAAERIHLFPGHGGGPGPQCAAHDRALWNQLASHFRPFDVLLDELPRWCEDLTGPPLQALRDIGGGAWRAHTRSRAPAAVRQERRKYLLHGARGTFLLKFAGLGSAGDGVFRRARVLAEGGFGPQALGLRNGFLVAPWIESRAPEGPIQEHVARYLAFRSRALPALSGTGASPARLLEMAMRNTSLALGEGAARALERWRPHLDQLSRDTVRVETDNRMHRWEWLQLPGGGILKADGADHCRGHDLVGCQDAAWDVAGASIELDLEGPALLRRFHEHGGRGGAPQVVAFSRACYLAFQLGAYTLAAESVPDMPDEGARLRAAAGRYRELLAHELRR